MPCFHEYFMRWAWNSSSISGWWRADERRVWRHHGPGTGVSSMPAAWARVQ